MQEGKKRSQKLLLYPQLSTASTFIRHPSILSYIIKYPYLFATLTYQYVVFLVPPNRSSPPSRHPCFAFLSFLSSSSPRLQHNHYQYFNQKLFIADQISY